MAATEVIHGTMSLGMMLAVSYILGQAGRPIDTILSAVIALQDSKVSLERIAEIRSRPLEVPPGEQGVPPPTAGDIELSGVSFAYPGGHDVLHDIDLTLRAGRVTAIVGTSGSGKTTLLKLLLRFVEPRAGTIRVDGVMLPAIDLVSWRRRCGVVMQGGHIFSETVARNISLGDESTDLRRMHEVARIARIEDFVQAMPRGYHTPVGPEGVGLSQGQRQRLLIARALYKEPDYIMLDEATSALDARNERAIVDGLSSAFAGRTAVVIAHRLSTVRNADHIVVLEGGRIVEQGDHAALVARRGRYFELVRDQLELGA